MFRKEAVAAAQHSDALVAHCAELGAEILENAAALLAPGGVLVYSTCTLLPAENREVTEAFLAAHPEFEPLDFFFPSCDPACPDIVSERGAVTLMPDLHGTDGFFIARMRRKD